MRLVNETRELNRVMFSKEDNNYKLSLLLEATKYLDAKKMYLTAKKK